MLTENNQTNQAQSYSLVTKLLIACGAIGPILFILVFLLEGATRPGYSVFRNYVSDLELSNQGWEQIANFLVCGLMCIGFSVGLGRIWRKGKASVWGPRLIGVFGLGLVAAGVFVTDPGRGYPAGAPLKGDPQTWHGYVHGINGLLVFTLLTIACFVVARRFASDPENRGWATYSRITGTLILLISLLSNVCAPLAENSGFPLPIGIIQRVMIILGWTWLALVAMKLLRQMRSSESLAHSAGEAPDAQVHAVAVASGHEVITK